MNNVKELIQKYAMKNYMPKLQRNLFRYDMINPQTYYDTSELDKNMLRQQRAMLNQLKNTDSQAMIANAMAYESRLDDKRSEINQRVKERNLQENNRVNEELNKQKQRKLIYDNQQIALNNRIAAANAAMNYDNMIKASNILYDTVMKGGQADEDIVQNQKNIDNYIKAINQDKMDLFQSENKELIEKYKKSKDNVDKLTEEVSQLRNLYNQSLGTPQADSIKKEMDSKVKELEKLTEEAKELDEKYKSRYREYMGTTAQEFERAYRDRLNMSGLNAIFRKSNKYAHKKPYLGTPFHVKKQGGSLTFSERKELERYKKDLQMQLKKFELEEKEIMDRIKQNIRQKERASNTNNQFLRRIYSKILKV